MNKSRRRRALPAVAATLALGAAVGALSASAGGSDTIDPLATDPRPPHPALITLSSAVASRPLPAGFLGLSIEFRSLEAYAGDNAQKPSPAFVQLIRNLAPGNQRPVLRIGGDSTDHTWWPVAHMPRPPGINYTLDRRWVAVAKSLAQHADAKLLLGINLEAGNARLAATEARAITNGIGAENIAALELGNEPELYGSFGWYKAPGGRMVPGRGRGYDFHAFTRQFAHFGAGLPAVPLAGPAIGGRQWIHHVGWFAAHQPRLQLVTVHRYPLQRCHLPAVSRLYPTIDHLLAPQAASQLATGIKPYVDVAHAHHRALRVDELNSVSCGGKPGVSDTFASALWSLDALFQMARAGVDGVNIHTFPTADYEPFELTHTPAGWRAVVEPVYYGLAMFARADPSGAHLLRLSSRDPGNPELHVWATKAPDGRVRAVLINDSTTAGQQVTLRAPSRTNKRATLARLTAPAVSSTNATTFAGQTYAAATGRLSGRRRTATVARTTAGYTVQLPPASAALLTLPR